MRLQAKNLSAGYGRKIVLHDISLGLNSGEFVGLMGPNGSGKSTLLRAISGVLPLTSGELWIDGIPHDKLSPKEIAWRIAFVPQTEPSAFDFAVRDVVLMGRHPHIGRAKRENSADFEIAARAMAATDILHIADRPITAISGGEHRRVLLARALAQSAPTLLLDEPTAHLDITHQVEILSTVRKQVSEQGSSSVAALHDLNLAVEFCDWLILLSEGRIAAEGAPESVMREELLSEVYGRGISVARNPLTGAPFVLPNPGHLPAEGKGPRVHVICGGGTGTAVMTSLLRRGYVVTAGVLNHLDSDEAACAALGIQAVVEMPFTGIGDEARARAEELIGQADAVILTEIPFGKGNLANLELARDAQKKGKRVLLLGGPALQGRDFSGGIAAERYATLVSNGATMIEDLASLDHALRRDTGKDAPLAVAGPGIV